MWHRTDPRPGATYLLHDYTVIQVLAVENGRVRYRTQSRLWWHRIRVCRASVPKLIRRIRAEINGEFFPDIALSGSFRFVHPPAEVAALRAHLAERAPHRPFTTP